MRYLDKSIESRTPYVGGDKNSRTSRNFLRLNELKNSIHGIRKTIDAVNYITSHIKEVGDEFKRKIKEIKKNIKTFLMKTRLILQNMLKNKKKKTEKISVSFSN